jgi:hypothetical protein
MCGRYARRGDKQRIAEAFRVKDVPDFAMPDADYNIAPTTFQPIIREGKDTGEREMVLMLWGLVPFFTKELSDVKGLSPLTYQIRASLDCGADEGLLEALKPDVRFHLVFESTHGAKYPIHVFNFVLFKFRTLPRLPPFETVELRLERDDSSCMSLKLSEELVYARFLRKDKSGFTYSFHERRTDRELFGLVFPQN